MRLWKAHGLGNDYLVWEGGANILDKPRVQAICDRHFGFGGDGILERIPSDRADYGVRIWNPDGSIAEKSGNGLRIFAHWLHYEKNAAKNFWIDTGFCIVQAQILDQKISIEMGKAMWKPEEIPTKKHVWGLPYSFDQQEIILYAVGMGNPHCVSFFDADQDLDALNWKMWGEILERESLFPNRSNIQFAKVLSRAEIEIRIWERGAGETSASGSSSCAVAAAAHRLGWVNEVVRMIMPGGELHITFREDGEIILLGPVEEVGRMELSAEFIQRWMTK